MIESYTDARNEIFGQLSIVRAQLLTIIGYDILDPALSLTVYQGLEDTTVKKPIDKFWIRISQQTAIETEANLAGLPGDRRYTSRGVAFVQVFIPKTAKQNYQIGAEAANTIKKAFRGKQTESCIWFRNVRIQELPPEEAWFRLNVLAEYTYDELG